MTFSLELLMGIGLNFTEMIPGWFSIKVVKKVQVQVFKMQFSKIFLSESTRPRAFIFEV